MELHQAQKQIAADTHRFRVVNCGRRFGKTTLAAWEMVGFAVSRPDARVPYYAPTRDDARDIMWKMLQEIAGNLIVEKNEGRLELTIRNKFGGTSLMPLYGWEAVQERKKGVGVKNNFVVLDEVAKYRGFWEGWEEVIRPTLTDVKGEALFISTPNGFNHFYELYGLQSKDEDYKSYHFTTYDNPFIPVEEVDKAKIELTEDRFAQEYMADFRKTEGLVYKEFSRERHLLNEDIDDDEWNIVKVIGGLDAGFTNPAAAITIRKSGSGVYLVSEEWYKTGQTDDQIADYTAALKWNECYPDPENPGLIEHLERRGVNVREVKKGKGSIANGINIVRELFKANRLYIHASCKNLIWELETYSYPERRPDHNEEENPIKENDHALDALRYALMMDAVQQERVAVQTRPAWISQRQLPSIIPNEPGQATQVRPNWIGRRR